MFTGHPYVFTNSFSDHQSSDHRPTDTLIYFSIITYFLSALNHFHFCADSPSTTVYLIQELFLKFQTHILDIFPEFQNHTVLFLDIYEWMNS